MVRRASEWAEAQRELRERYQADPAGLPRLRVHWRTVPPSAVPLPGGIGPFALVTTVVALARLARRTVAGKNLSSSAVVAVWPASAPEGAEAGLIFEVATNPAAAEGEGMLVGEPDLKRRALCRDRRWPGPVAHVQPTAACLQRPATLIGSEHVLGPS